MNNMKKSHLNEIHKLELQHLKRMQTLGIEIKRTTQSNRINKK